MRWLSYAALMPMAGPALLLIAACTDDGVAEPGLPPPPPPNYLGSTELVQFQSVAGLFPEEIDAYSAWSVSPALPRNLTLNSVTGEIMGAPWDLQAPTGYTVSATNASGQASTILHLSVTAPEVDALPDPPCYGVNYVSYYNGPTLGLDSAASAYLINQLVPQTGANCVALVWNWYVDTLEDTNVRAITVDAPNDPQYGPTATAEQLAYAIGRFRAQGLRVWLKPHVDVRDGSYRGEIRFSDPDAYQAWMDHYDTLLMQAADLARQYGAYGLVIGTELDSLADNSDAAHTQRWSAVIAGVRQRFSGYLSYAANWPTAEAIGFWDQLDVMGVDAYFPLSSAAQPQAEELQNAWYYSQLSSVGRPYEYLGKLVTRHHKPLMLTEIGYRSRSHCAADPADYSDIADDDPQNDAMLDEACQVNAYQAMYAQFGGQPWLAGMLVWNWEVFPGAETGTLPDDADPDQHYLTRGFTSYGKPSAQVMRNANLSLAAGASAVSR